MLKKGVVIWSGNVNNEFGALRTERLIYADSENILIVLQSFAYPLGYFGLHVFL